MDVVIFIGSESDYELIKDAVGVLKEFGVSYRLEVTSAHRSPERTRALIADSEKKGAKVFIAAAGRAAHLAGFVAGQTSAPVIGVPVESGGLGGLDALLSTVQMPKGVPVAAMGLGKAGASNAAILAVQILGVKNPLLKKKLDAHKKTMAAQVESASKKLPQS
ncbi:MAG: 5-(carboxyamino)imidazole ribonucleotide mutase [Candidatus Aminicenantes bacterium RBG_13_62_12]|jgi:phosphoribosylaminoimidazole carboxylase PurE protein|nr:MAG: 5-(carboxyamino)imidazole ribonucleotide mutase [Candidatus Aminicenantes bacterium RBG_13_62_12]